jgi:hypothetical protein
VTHSPSPELSTLMNQISERNTAVMAQKVQTIFIDDLDASPAEGTVRFGLDGTDYEIDLNAEHAQQLRDTLARYVSAARRTGGIPRRPSRSGRRAQSSGLNTTEVREWAKAQGIDVKDRGRIPAELLAKFKAATAK